MKAKLFFLSFLLIAISCQSKNSINEKGESQQVEAVVGTRVYSWTDSSRIDAFYGGYRRVTVQIWYPAQQAKSMRRAGYIPELERIQTHLKHWSEEDIHSIKKLRTKAYQNIGIFPSPEAYPILFFSPSLGGHRNYYNFYAEAMVRKGYVVVGVNHQHESNYVLGSDNNIIPLNHKFHDSLKTLQIPDQITADEYRAQKSNRLQVLGKDLIFCIKKLEQLNQTIFKNLIDFENIGTWGHSIGGAAAIAAARVDPRIKAVLNMDGTPPSEALKNGINAHFLFLEDLTDYRNHQGYKKQFDRRSDFCKKNRGDSYRVLLANINHNSFTDLNYHFAGNEEEKERSKKTLDTCLNYMATFFKRYLKGEDGEIEAVISEEVEVFKY